MDRLCSRCKRSFDNSLGFNESAETATIQIRYSDKEIEYHLCERCSKDLEKWIPIGLDKIK